MNRLKIIAAKIFAGYILFCGSHVFAAGIPVFDGASIVQTTITAFESVEQTINEIYQLQTQLQQYELQIKNSLAPAAYVWTKAQHAMGRLQQLYSDVDAFTNQVGGIDAYLQKFMTPSQYAGTPYFSEQNVASAERRAEQRRQLSEAQKQGTEAQIAANKAVLMGVQAQNQELKDNAYKLEDLQAKAQSAEGQMAAMQYANQFAAMQNDQLLQLRAMLAAQQNMMAVQSQLEADDRARSQAATDAFLARKPPEYKDPTFPRFNR
jgi:P-type conjugative transfer protein TrbJ